MSKPIDYDSSRRSGVETDQGGAEEIKARHAAVRSRERDLDDAEVADTFELPAADLSGEELTVPVVPRQPDEFRCTRCFLVHHRNQLAAGPDGQDLCRECS